jgi:hypothetical protein
MDARLDLVEFAIRGFDITIEDVRDQGQTAARMVEGDDGIGEEKIPSGTSIAYDPASFSTLELVQKTERTRTREIPPARR